MTLLIFAIIVIALLGIAVYAIDRSPIAPTPKWIIQVLMCVVAIIVIAQRAGIV